MSRTRSPEQLLFTNLEEEKGQLQDIIDEGLDGGYEDRIPELIDLMDSGNPYHQLLACVVLVSWGIEEGFTQALNWASNYKKLPWEDSPVVSDRLYGVDSSFEMLADAVRTSFWCNDQTVVRPLQVNLLNTFLRIYSRVYFGQMLALAMIRNSEVPQSIKPEIMTAIENGLSDLTNGPSVEFDLAFQISSLLLPLAFIDDEITASYANRMLSMPGLSKRSLYEVISALGSASGTATLEILNQLQYCDFPDLEKEIKRATNQRKKKRGPQ